MSAHATETSRRNKKKKRGKIFFPVEIGGDLESRKFICQSKSANAHTIALGSVMDFFPRAKRADVCSIWYFVSRSAVKKNREGDAKKNRRL